MDWMEVLDRVQDALTRAETEAAERERGFPRNTLDVAREDDAQAPLSSCLARLDGALQAIEAGMAEKEQQSIVMDGELQAGEESLRKWLSAVQAAQQSLADRGKSEV